MAQRVRKITPEILKQIIVQEARKIQMEVAQEKAKHPEDVDAHELDDAGGYAHTLAHHKDHYKELKLKETQLLRQLEKIQERKNQVRREISRTSR